MSLLVTHIDDDGKAAAAIAYREMFKLDERPCLEDIVYYNYQHQVIAPDHVFHEHETVVIVDLSLDEWIFDLVRRAVEAGCEVIHIDHHATTLAEMEQLTDAGKAIYEKVKTFFHPKFSAAMLCWIWVSAHPEEREDILSTVANVIDFSAGRELLVFHPGQGANERIYRIPDVIRYIDDWDIWRFDLKDTKPFHYGFNLELDKSPDSKLWDELLYNYNAPIIVGKKYLEPGRTLMTFYATQYSMLQTFAFETKIPGYENLSCIATNGHSNSFAFGDLMDTYDVCVLFYYDGSNRNWKYSIYSKDTDDSVDVSKIAESFGGGGHPHASGFRTDELIFK